MRREKDGEFDDSEEEEDLGVDPAWFERVRPARAATDGATRVRAVGTDKKRRDSVTGTDRREGTIVGNPFTEKMPKPPPKIRAEATPPPPDFFRDPTPDAVLATTKFKKLTKKPRRAPTHLPEPSAENAPTERGAEEAPLFLDIEVEVAPSTLKPAGIVQLPAEVTPLPVRSVTPPPAPSGPPPIPADAKPASPSMLDMIAPTHFTPPAIPIPDPPPLHPTPPPLYRTPAVGWVAPPVPPTATVSSLPPAPQPTLADLMEAEAPPVTFVPSPPPPTPTPETEAQIVDPPPPPEAGTWGMEPAASAEPEPLPEPEPLSQPDPTPAPAAEASRKGKVILLFGCRGGAGATTLAVNIAASMARQQKEVCLVDLDLQLGDVFVSLDLDSKITLAHMAREAPIMDAAALRRRLPRHESGVYALSQAGRVDDIDPGLVDQVPTLLGKLAQHFDVVLIDGVRDFGDFALAALDSADEIALVFTQDVPSVRRAGRIIQVCRKLGYPDRKLRLVLNRFTGDSKVSEEEIERALGLPVLARVANDYRATRRAQDDGVLIADVAGRTKITRDVRQVAELLAKETEQPSRKKGLFSRFLGGR